MALILSSDAAKREIAQLGQLRMQDMPPENRFLVVRARQTIRTHGSPTG